MKVNRFLKLLIFILSVNLFFSCSEDIDLDFNKLSTETTIETSVAIPLIKADITLSDLIKEVPDTVIYNADNSIDIIFRQDSIFGINLSEYFTLPSFQQAEAKDIQIGDFDFSDRFFEETISASDLGILYSGAVPVFPGFTIPLKEVNTDSSIPMFEKGTFSSGNISLTLTNNFETTIEAGLIVWIRNRGDNTIAEFTFPEIPAGQTVTSDPVDLSGVEVKNEFSIVIEDFTLRAATDVNINPVEDGLHFKFDIRDMKVESGTLLFEEKILPRDSKEIYFGNEDQKLYYIKLRKGRLNIVFNSDIHSDAYIKLIFPKITDRYGEIKDTTVHVMFDDFGNAQDVNLDFSGCEMDLNSGSSPYHSTFLVEYEIVIPEPQQAVTFSPQSKVQVILEIEDMEFAEVEGYFGEHSIEIPSGYVNTHIDLLDFIDGGFTLTDPRINLLLSNSIGVPVLVEVDLLGKNVLGDEVGFTKNFTTTSPTKANPYIQEVLEINRDNSNIVNFIDLAPEKIYYSAKVTSNAQGDDGTLNFLTDTSKMNVGLELKLPLELQSENLFYIDTLEITLGEDLPDVDEATVEMYFMTENEFPFELSVVISPFEVSIDNTSGLETKTFFDDIIGNIMESPDVDATGRAIAPKISRNTLILNQNDIDNLKRATNIAIKVSMKTSQDGQVPVKLYSDSSLKLSVGIKADFKIKTE